MNIKQFIRDMDSNDDHYIYNFNIAPCGKTYYEMNKSWRYIKRHIKDILDSTDSYREHKINSIIGMLEMYKATYLRSKGSDKK